MNKKTFLLIIFSFILCRATPLIFTMEHDKNGQDSQLQQKLSALWEKLQKEYQSNRYENQSTYDIIKNMLTLLMENHIQISSQQKQKQISDLWKDFQWEYIKGPRYNDKAIVAGMIEFLEFAHKIEIVADNQPLKYQRDKKERQFNILFEAIHIKSPHLVSALLKNKYAPNDRASSGETALKYSFDSLQKESANPEFRDTLEIYLLLSNYNADHNKS